jgi:hypothetical protein
MACITLVIIKSLSRAPLTKRLWKALKPKLQDVLKTRLPLDHEHHHAIGSTEKVGNVRIQGNQKASNQSNIEHIVRIAEGRFQRRDNSAHLESIRKREHWPNGHLVPTRVEKSSAATAA